MNSVSNIHSRVATTVPRQRKRTPVELLRPFEGRAFRVAGAEWTYRRIAAHVGHNVLVMCCCFQQLSVEHYHIRIPGFGESRSTDARPDRRIVRAAVAARTASREEIREHVRASGK